VLLYQICGASHRDTALCYQTLALILARSDDPSAVAHQQRAVILFSKLVGADHIDTAAALAQLGVFQHRFGQSKAALESLRRSLYIIQLAGGPHNGRSCPFYHQLGLVYQDVGQSAMAIACFRECLRCARGDADGAASALQQLAQAYLLAGDTKQSFEVQIKAHLAMHALYGENDPRTQQAFVLLNQIHHVRTCLRACVRACVRAWRLFF
jgi:tetratricopeptide (TPR) repeat protein